MLDDFELAIRKYRRIAPDPGADMNLGRAQQLARWLEHDVGRLVEALMDRPDFRRRVRWPLEMLAHDERGHGHFSSQRRELLLEIDRNIVSFATELAKRGAQMDEACPGINAPQHSEIAKMRAIAERPWDDLVTARDYFHPAQPPIGPEQIQMGNFLPYLNPLLREPGDFVSRCAEIRIRELIEDLDRFYRRLWTLSAGDNDHPDSKMMALAQQSNDLKNEFSTLRQLCFDGRDARLRDSCIALLQVFIGFHQDADIEWLGVPREYYQHVADIPDRVQRRHQWDVPERVFAAVNEIAEIVRRAQSPEDVIEEKKSTTRLVLVEEQRSVFLDGVPADSSNHANWHGRHFLSWELLWTLADRAKVRRSVDGYDLSNPKATRPVDDAGFPEPLSEQAVKDRRAELKRLISPELNGLIKPAGPGTYRLVLEPTDVCLLGWFTDERLVELDAQPARHSPFTRFTGRTDEIS